MKVLTCYCISYLTVNYVHFCMVLTILTPVETFLRAVLFLVSSDRIVQMHTSLFQKLSSLSLLHLEVNFSHLQKFGVVKIAQVSWFRMPWYDIHSGKNKTDWCAHLINLMGNFTSTLTRMLQKNKWWPTTNQFLLKYFFWLILHLSSWSFLLF